jgi:hypothetical protein
VGDYRTKRSIVETNAYEIVEQEHRARLILLRQVLRIERNELFDALEPRPERGRLDPVLPIAHRPAPMWQPCRLRADFASDARQPA